MAPLGNDRQPEDAEFEPAESAAEPDFAEEEQEQFALADEDEQLPWLESDEDYEEDGFDWRLLVWAFLGLFAVGILLAAVWFLVPSGNDGEIVADGSTIEAPDAPYKTRPDDPGGTEVDGTGNVSFEIGEGEGRESRLAEDDPVRPSIDREQAASEQPAAEAVSGVGVQVGAYSSRASAQEGWQTLRGRYEALSGLKSRILEAQVDGARIYRLQAVAGSESAARDVCQSIRAAGGDCQVKK